MNAELKEFFTNPPAIYRGAPFWAWNCRLNKEQLLRQIDCFHEMGLGGFHMHSRTGLDTEYLGTDFMEMVKACTLHAKSKKMLAWLYDEDRWPSGFAGGLVTRDEQYRARHLLFTTIPYGEDGSGAVGRDSRSQGGRYENGELLASYAVKLKDGVLTEYRRLEGEKAGLLSDEICWYAYLEKARPSDWFNNQTYVDTLNPDAIHRFVEVTHERYAAVVGDEFGLTIPAIFTDEPQFVRKGRLPKAAARKDVIIPWTEELAGSFEKKYGGDLLEHLPEVFWELPEGRASVWRYRYHDHVAEMFAAAFADVAGGWCREHGIALTGHLMEEPTLTSQTTMIGDAMRSYRGFDIPGIDVLCDRVEGEFSTAKQAQSAVHQYGGSGVLSELYGVTNWDFDFAGHKRQGDWQAALGVAYRVHHLSWVSMAGEAKRDYPASISYQSPWWREYRVVEDHFARVNAVLTRGKPVVHVGVLHPVESLWLCYGPDEQTQEKREEREQFFAEQIRWMLYGFIDFDFIAESLLPMQDGGSAAGGFRVGAMEYDAVLVPPMRTIRSTTLERLENFSQEGGRIVFAGEIPSLVDAVPSDRARKLAERSERVPFLRTRLLSAFCNEQDIRLLNSNGVQVDKCLYQLREEGEERYLFVCNTRRTEALNALSLQIKGEWRVFQMDTHSGGECSVAVSYSGGNTVLPCDLPAHGSLLLRMVPGCADGEGINLCATVYREVTRLHGPVPVTLSEPNVLVFEKAAWRIDAGEWHSSQQILELDPLIRKQLAMPGIHGRMAQPWTDRDEVAPVAQVSLRMVFRSETAVAAPQLALENARNAVIMLDGNIVEKELTGYFTDEAIATVRLPDFAAGIHTLELTIPYTRKTYLEWMYLLGDFGVTVFGDSAKLTDPVRELAFGDWTVQGLPFYAGNVTYHCAIPEGVQAAALRVPHFKGALVKARVMGEVRSLAFAPYRVELPETAKAGTAIDLTVFGTRINAFGQIHNCAWKYDPQYSWWGPASWRTGGDAWSDEYVLRPMGIMSGPVLEERD